LANGYDGDVTIPTQVIKCKLIFFQAISQLDCSIHIKLNYQILLTVVGFDRMVRTADIAQLPYVEATLMEVQRLANTGIQ
jgi:hypothetical protein